ncbi:MAG TPA: hypothetical protein VGO52_21455 [Hyphomonadaceae bacterium]|nr:hypothetical protein [Hyphomonadaceae bacterium]
MKLDSVRSLKAQLSGGLASAAGVAAHNLSAFAVGVSASAAPKAQRRVALGVTSGTGRNDFRLAARFPQKRNGAADAAARALHTMAKGEVEIRFVGKVRKQAKPPWYRSEQRPLLIGASIGHFNVTAGTIGAFVYVGHGRSLHVLSNNHVLANENHAKKGDAILQPGSYDGGADPDERVAELTDWKPLSVKRKNLIDAAIAKVVKDVDCERIIITGQTTSLAGVRKAPLDIDEIVSKLGRTTGFRRGKVTAVELDGLPVTYDDGDCVFDDQIEIEGGGQRPFSDGGDSGSIIMDGDGMACALLFAGGEEGGSNGKGLTYANPIAPVMDALNLRLAL